MNWWKFRAQFFEMGYFNIHQVYAWNPNFERNNIVRWTHNGYLVKLRQAFYSFPEYLQKPDFPLLISSKIYSPSYISLHTCLSFYGLIPEAVTQITAVTSLKTYLIKNIIGTFSYKSIKNDLFFGYKMQTTFNSQEYPFATVEKAILDLLYLYPFYNTEQDMIELRIDETMLKLQFNKNSFLQYLERFNSKSLNKRSELFLKAYSL